MLSKLGHFEERIVYRPPPHLVLGDIFEPDEEKGLEGLHVLGEAVAEHLDEGPDGHEGVLLHAASLVVHRRLEHLQERRHDRVRDLRRVLSLHLAQDALQRENGTAD